MSPQPALAPGTRVVLLRHGQTDWNAQGRFQGQMDVGLNAVGVAQARAAARPVADLGIDVIISSDLERARDTAAPVAQLTGLPVATDPGVREIDVGSWGGLTIDEMAAADPSALAALTSDDDFRRSATGETATEAGARMARALSAIVAAHPGQTVLVVSHGLVIRTGIAAVLGWTHRQARQLAGVANCSWSVLTHRESGWRLESYNTTARPPGD